MDAMEIDQNWQSAFHGIERPQLYASYTLAEDGFLPLNEPQAFFQNIDGLEPAQLHTASTNNALALRKAQDEYRLLDKWIAELNEKEPRKDPQQLLSHDEAEHRKQAILYSYKYETPKPRLLLNQSADVVSEQEKRDVRHSPEPFQAGGFIPTISQHKAIVAKAKNPHNPDDFPIVHKGGKSYVPRQQLFYPEYTHVYKKRDVDENGQVIRNYSSDEEEGSPSRIVNKRLTRTRYNGTKHPPTRDLSEAPSTISSQAKRQGTPKRALEEDASPAPKRSKLNAEGKPRHHNQYTKARERAMQAALLEQKQQQQTQLKDQFYQQYSSSQQAQDQPAQQPIFAPPNTIAMMQVKVSTQQATTVPKTKLDIEKLMALSVKDKRDRKWADDELCEVVKLDHSWLNSDPVKAVTWRDSVLKGRNPVRTYSMLRKWAQWGEEGTNKRPRKKKEDSLPADSGDGRQKPRPLARSRRALKDAELTGDFASAPPSPLRNSFGPADTLNNDRHANHVEPNGALINGTRSTDDNNSIKNERRPSTKSFTDTEESQEPYEEIEVEQTIKEEPMSTRPIRATRMNRKQSQTSTPSPNGNTQAGGTPTKRRSLRSSRRGSA